MTRGRRQSGWLAAGLGLAVVTGSFWLGRITAPSSGPVREPRTESPGPASLLSTEGGKAGGGQPAENDGEREGSEAWLDEQTLSLEETLSAARLQLDRPLNIRSIVDVFRSVESIGPESMKEALDFVREMPDFQQKNLLFMAVLTQWAMEDGKGAADYAAANFEGEQKPGMVAAVISNWASEDPAAAWDWLSDYRATSFPNPMHEGPVLRSLFQGIATTDFDLAMQRLEEIENFDLRTVALDGIGSSVRGEEQRTAFLEYAQTIENREQRVRATNAVIAQWAQSEPAAAARWVDTLEAGEQRSAAVKAVGMAWFQSAPEDASAWYLQSVSQEQYPQAVLDLAQRWLHRDPETAGEWLGQFEPGPESDPAVATFAQGIVGIDPASAVEWAATIENPEMRERSMVNIFKNWQQRDESAARAAIGNSGLSDEQIAGVFAD